MTTTEQRSMDERVPFDKPNKLTVEYWECGRHRHKSKEDALKCIQGAKNAAERRMGKNAQAEDHASLRASESMERKLSAFKLRKCDGLSYKEIGERLRVTASRARDVAEAGHRIMKSWTYIIADELPPRCEDCHVYLEKVAKGEYKCSACSSDSASEPTNDKPQHEAGA